MAGRKKHRTVRVVREKDRPTWDALRRRRDLNIDWSSVTELRDQPNGMHLPVTGECHDCGRQVTGERKFCGPCLASH